MITKKEFMAFESIRRSGVTNMFDIRVVVALANMNGVKMTRESCIEILEGYSELKAKYMGEGK
jgi:hypothetical protein